MCTGYDIKECHYLPQSKSEYVFHLSVLGWGPGQASASPGVMKCLYSWHMDLAWMGGTVAGQSRNAAKEGHGDSSGHGLQGE